MKPGLYENMPDAEYRAIDAVSNSGLTQWATGRDIDPATADWGSAMHAAILEPDVASKKIVGLEPKQKRSSHPLADSDEAWVMTNSKYRALVGSVESIKEHPQLGKLLEMANADRKRCEVVAIWTDDESGLLCKAKIDQYTDKSVIDWKSTSSTPDDFAYSIAKFNYQMQAAHYMEGAAACGIGREQFLLACVCNRPDKQHVCWIHPIDGPALTAGYTMRRMMLTLYARYGQESTNENV